MPFGALFVASITVHTWILSIYSYWCHFGSVNCSPSRRSLKKNVHRGTREKWHAWHERQGVCGQRNKDWKAKSRLKSSTEPLRCSFILPLVRTFIEGTSHMPSAIWLGPNSRTVRMKTCLQHYHLLTLSKRFKWWDTQQYCQHCTRRNSKLCPKQTHTMTQ